MQPTNPSLTVAEKRQAKALADACRCAERMRDECKALMHCIETQIQPRYGRTQATLLTASKQYAAIDNFWQSSLAFLKEDGQMDDQAVVQSAKKIQGSPQLTALCLSLTFGGIIQPEITKEAITVLAEHGQHLEESVASWKEIVRTLRKLAEAQLRWAEQICTTTRNAAHCWIDSSSDRQLHVRSLGVTVSLATVAATSTASSSIKTVRPIKTALRKKREQVTQDRSQGQSTAQLEQSLQWNVHLVNAAPTNVIASCRLAGDNSELMKALKKHCAWNQSKKQTLRKLRRFLEASERNRRHWPVLTNGAFKEWSIIGCGKCRMLIKVDKTSRDVYLHAGTDSTIYQNAEKARSER